MTLLKTLLLLGLLAVVGAGVFLFSGAYNVAADDPHWPATVTLIDTLRERSIAARSKDVAMPADLDDVERVRRGAGNYDAMCTGCHLKPDMADSEIRKGLYPKPPNLAQAADSHGHEHAQDATARVAARQFRIIKHGIKMTGMPAWSKAGVDDDTIWDMVALLQRLPEIGAAEYRALVDASEGHSHAGAGDGHGQAQGRGDSMQDRAVRADHVDPPGAAPHQHAPKPAQPVEGEGVEHPHDHQR